MPDVEVVGNSGKNFLRVAGNGHMPVWNEGGDD